MMRTVSILLRVQTRALLSSLFRPKNRKSTAPLSTGMLLLFSLLFLYLIGVFLFMAAGISVALCLPLCEAGADALYFAIMATLTFAINILFSARMTQGSLFESKDNELLLAMPIPPRAILVSRMLFLYLSNLFFSLIVLVPAGVVYLIFGTPSVSGVISYLLGTVTLPLLSLAVSCLFGWLLALLSSRMRNKSLLPTVLTLLFLLLYFLVCSKARDILAYLTGDIAGIVARVRTFLFPFWCYGEAITGNPLWLFLFLLVSVLPILLVLYILDRSFIGIATASHNGPKAKYRARRVDMRSQVGAFRRKELARLVSSSPYLLNAGLGVVFLFVGGIALLIKRGTLADLAVTLGEAGLPDGFIPAILMAAMLFIAAMSLMGACSVSMEGKTIWIAQSLPTDGRAPLLGKLTAAFILYLPATVFASVCGIIALTPGFVWSLLILLLPSVFTVFMCCLGLLFNLMFPRLDWMDETAAVKQGMSVLLTMLIGFASIGLLVVPCVLLSFVAPLWIPVAVVTVLLAAVSLVLYRTLLGYGTKRYFRIGE